MSDYIIILVARFVLFIKSEMVKMKSGNKIKQMVLAVPEHGSHEGCLIGNSNTGRLHSPECSAIDMMREDHKIPTDGGHFTPLRMVSRLRIKKL